MAIGNLSIKQESQRFKDHLSLENNYRIIFSGIFGIGKTYFINKFCEEHSDIFIPIRINPVNYSVSKNEDIFELIKFDIAFQLFALNPNFEKTEFTETFSGLFYIQENYKEIIKTLTKKLLKLNQHIESITKPILELGEKIEEFHKKQTIDEEHDLNRFMEFFSLEKGTYREENHITQLLFALINNIKQNNSTKKIVLIIDDLDRIDPEHIFRILNIFSAHLNYYDYKDENKFGFDKIVLICDIENIRGIFHNKYGTDIDFSGYIDKFYSTEIFEYSFKDVIIENLTKFIENIPIESLQHYFYNDRSNYYVSELSFLITHFINSNCLSMRTLVNFLSNKIVLRNFKVDLYALQTNNIFSNQTPILNLLGIIEKILGGKHNLIKTLNKTIAQFPSIEITPFDGYWNQRMGNLIMLIEYKNNNFFRTQKPFFYRNTELDLHISYKINNTEDHYGVIGEAIRIGKANENIQESSVVHTDLITQPNIPYFQLYMKAIKSFYSISKEFR